MPQMMPLNWISLLFLFMFLFYVFNNLIFFMMMPKNKKTNYSLKQFKLTWKW
nr:ATP synthase subunit 8 [Psylliodes attenuatus]